MSLFSSPTQAAEQAAYQKAMAAYVLALGKLRPSWQALPLAPYPPAGMNAALVAAHYGGTFPQTGAPSLMLTQSMVSPDQLAEPGKVTAGLLAVETARVPHLNGYFVIGAVCLAAYFIAR